MEYFFKQAGGWVGVEIEILLVTALVPRGVECQWWAGAVSLSLASGLLQLDFGSQWFGEPHIVCSLSACYRVSVETEEKEKLVFGGCEGLVLALDQENPEWGV